MGYAQDKLQMKLNHSSNVGLKKISHPQDPVDKDTKGTKKELIFTIELCALRVFVGYEIIVV